MLCDSCKERDAVVHLTTIQNNAVTLLHLCEKCAAAKGIETTETVPKNPVIGDFLQAVQQQLVAPNAENGRCTFCGATLRDFRATGRLGCARCYEAFQPSLRDLLRRVHGHSRHVGRRYAQPNPMAMERNALLGELKDRLQRAIDSEQFELAADLRDRIRVLE